MLHAATRIHSRVLNFASRRPSVRANPASPDWAAAPARQLALAALAIGVIIGAILVAPMPVWAGHPLGPLADRQLGPSDSGVGWPGILLAIGFALALCLPYRPYAHALKSAAQVDVRQLLGLTVALGVVALCVYPRFGSDLFVYAAYERLWTVYGANPLLAAPGAYPTDWAAAFVWIPEQPNPYGPLWVLLTWPIAALAGTSAEALVAGYKLLALAGYVGCCALLATWPGSSTEQRRRALLTFAWSPLVLFETLGKAHNDVLLALGALLAVRLAGSAAGLLAAVGAGLIKLNGLAVLPSVTVALVRKRRWSTLVVASLGGALLLVAAYAPFWRGPETLLPVLFQTSRVVWSPGSLLIAAGLDPTAVRLLLASVWLVTTVYAAWRIRNPATSAALVLLATLLLLTTAFFAHYLVPAVALGAVSTSPRLRRLVLALSLGALAAYAVEVLGVAFGSGWLGSRGFQALGSVILLAPAALVLARQSRLPIKPARAARCEPRVAQAAPR